MLAPLKPGTAGLMLRLMHSPFNNFSLSCTEPRPKQYVSPGVRALDCRRRAAGRDVPRSARFRLRPRVGPRACALGQSPRRPERPGEHSPGLSEYLFSRGSAGDPPASLGDSPSGMGRRHRWPAAVQLIRSPPRSVGRVARRDRPVACSTPLNTYTA